MLRYLALGIGLLLFPFAPAAASDDKYAELHRAALAGVRPVDWTALRYAYSESSQLDLFGVSTMTLRKEMGEAFLSGNSDLALERSRQILEKEFFDIEAWMVCGHVWSQRGDMEKAGDCYDNVDSIVVSIMAGGDGKTAETAFTVIAIREEYAMLGILGLKFERQTLIHKDGHNYDVLEAMNENGQRHSVHFQIDRIWNAYDRVMGDKSD